MRALYGLCLFSTLVFAQTQQSVDPTKPANMLMPAKDITAAQDVNGIQVTAILQKADTYFAIVNDRVMRVGDQDFGATVKSIDQDTVVLEIVTNGVMEERRLRVISAENIKKNATENF